MQVKKLIESLKIREVVNNLPKEISQIYTVSSQVKENGMFVCINGFKADGHDFAEEAVKNGATCIVCQKKLDLPVCQIIVEDTHKAISLLASAFYGNPAQKLKIICVVGTNGKTSTAFIIDGILNSSGGKSALISTNGIYIDGNYIKNDMTTPDPLVLNGLFAQMVDANVEFCVMEMSAHAIEQQKLYGAVADLAVFTNFSQDHLDYFGTLENYRQVKKSFFNKDCAKVAVVNADDELGKEILKEENIQCVSYGLDNPADVFAIDVSCEGDSSSYVMNIYDEIAFIRYKLSGRFNVYNTLAAATVCRVFGINLKSIAKGISQLKCIEGRNQSICFPKGFKVVVDFAHTPEGIANILSYLRDSTFGKLIVVFGCGGDRDKSKRKPMGKAVSKYADYAYLTSDNPRSEDPFEIMFEAEKGLYINHELVCDRKTAITKAVNMAKQDDAVAILGKGHEKYQEINGVKYPFSDMEVVLDLLSANSLR
jgi:UDP-N-acetylmuramoyl-L-alanyl-D-glutamate--2,6-diaminopimelate ligase